MKFGRNFLITSLTFLIVLGISSSFIVLIRQRQQAALRTAVAEIGESHAHSLGTRLDRSLAAAYALASVLRQGDEIKNFDALAAEMIDIFGGITNLQLAPNGIVQQIYPLAGNEAAIGHDLLNDPALGPEALAAIESQELTLAGPFALAEGGTAVIGRLPVFLPEENGQEQFWGFVNVLIELTDLLAAGNLNQLENVGYDYQLSRQHPDTGQFEVIAHSGTGIMDDPVSIPVQVFNGDWQLAIAPQGGWIHPPLLQILIAVAVLLSLVLSGLVHQIVYHAMKLADANVQMAAEVSERRQAQLALKEVNEELELHVETRTAELRNTVFKLEQEIVERTEAEAAVAKLSKAVTASSEVIFMTDPDGIFTYVNPAFEKLYGFDAPDVIGKATPRILKSGQMPMAAYEELWATLIKKQVLKGEIINRAKDGRIVTMSVSANPILDHDDEITGFLAIQQDITYRKQAEQALRQAETRYRELFENAPVMYVTTLDHPDGPIIQDCNNVFSKMIGLERGQIIQRPLIDFYTPDSQKQLLNGGYKRALAGSVDEEERELVTENGLIIKTLLHASPEYNASGKITGTRAMYVDITARKETEQALQQSEARYRTVVEDQTELIVRWRPDSTRTFVNEAYCRAFGKTRDEMIGTSFFPLIVEEEQQAIWQKIAAITPETPVQVDEHRVYYPDGSVGWQHWTDHGIFDENGEILEIQSVGRDITVRKRREQELEALIKVAETVRTAHTRAELAPVILEQLADLLEASGVALILVDAETGEGYVEMGQGMCAAWTAVRLPPKSGVTGMVIETGEPYQHDNVHSDSRIIRPDLVEGINSVACVPLTVQEERLGVLWLCRDTAVSNDELRFMVAIADIAASAIQRAMLFEESVQYAANLEEYVAERTHELAEANEQLQELDQLKSKFVSDVSHELRTPITNIKLYLDLMIRGRPENSERYIQILRQEADRLTRLVEDTLELSRLDGAEKGLWQRSWADINQIAGQVVDAFQAKAASAELNLSFAPSADLPPVWAEPNQLAQVVTNLVTNALNYTPNGEVIVQTAVADEKNTVCLLVKDTGVGIPTKDRQHLFERFYRGQYAGQSAIPGTGLGLAIVKEIVDLHGGQISVENNGGQGTVFRIYLPTFAKIDVRT